MEPSEWQKNTKLARHFTKSLQGTAQKAQLLRFPWLQFEFKESPVIIHSVTLPPRLPNQRLCYYLVRSGGRKEGRRNGNGNGKRRNGSSLTKARLTVFSRGRPPNPEMRNRNVKTWFGAAAGLSRERWLRHCRETMNNKWKLNRGY